MVVVAFYLPVGFIWPMSREPKLCLGESVSLPFFCCWWCGCCWLLVIGRGCSCWLLLLVVLLVLLELLVLAVVIAGDGGDGEVSWVIEAKMWFPALPEAWYVQMGLGTRLDDDGPGEQVVVQLNFEPKGVGPLVNTGWLWMAVRAVRGCTSLETHRTTISEGLLSLLVFLLLWFEFDVDHHPSCKIIELLPTWGHFPYKQDPTTSKTDYALWVGAGYVDPTTIQNNIVRTCGRWILSSDHGESASLQQ